MFERKIISLYEGRIVLGYSGELSKLKQDGHTLEHYQEEFLRLSHQVQDLSVEFLVGYFISGVRDAIKYDIVAKILTTMDEAMRLAPVEEKLQNLRKTSKPVFQKSTSPFTQSRLSIYSISAKS